MELITILILIVLGIVLLIVEFMLIPGLTVAGIGSVLSFAASVYFAFEYYGKGIGFVTLAGIIIFVPVFLYFLFKGRASRPIMLETNIDGKVDTIEEASYKIGDEGVTTGRLAPAGKAKINGKTHEVRSLGSFIDEKTNIKIVKIEGNTIFVEPINE